MLSGVAALACATAFPRSHALGIPPPLRVGLLLPRSGYLAAAGMACARGAILAQRLLSSSGGPRIAITAGDTGEEVETARRSAGAMLESGVDLIIGCYDSAQTVAVAALAEAHHIPMLINIGAAPTITQQGYQYVFRNFPDAVRIVRDSYRLQKELFRVSGFTPRRVALLYINNGRGIELIDSLRAEAQMPYEWAASIPYDPRTPDVATVVARARASGADALWTVSRVDDSIRITRELVRIGWTPSVLMSSNAALHEAAYREALGVYADYAITFAPFYAPNTRLAHKVQSLQAELEPGTPLDTAEVYTCEAVLVAADAYRRAASGQSDALAAALRATHMHESLSGPPVSFDEHGQNTALGLTAIQNLGGVGQVILPRTAAQAKPVLPMPPWSTRTRAA